MQDSLEERRNEIVTYLERVKEELFRRQLALKAVTDTIVALETKLAKVSGNVGVRQGDALKIASTASVRRLVSEELSKKKKEEGLLREEVLRAQERKDSVEEELEALFDELVVGDE